MFEWLEVFLKSSIEYKEIINNGFLSTNTISALGTVFFTFFQGYGVFKQAKTIWEKRSGDGVSPIMMNYTFLYFITFGIYGFFKVSIAMMINSLLCFVFLPVVLGLIKFRKFKKVELISSILFIPMIPIMIFVNEKDVFVFILLIGAIFTLIPQPIEAYQSWKKGDPGAIDPNFLFIFLLTDVFWFVFALTVGNWPLIIFNPVAFSIFLINIIFWKLAKKKKESLYPN